MILEKHAAPTGFGQETIIRAALEHLRVEPDQVIELRALDVPGAGGRRCTVAGYFNDLGALAAEAARLERSKPAGMYVTLNKIDPSLLARACNRVVFSPKATTSDKDIVSRVWLPFDFDPIRPSGIAASDEEVNQAKSKALAAVEWIGGEFGVEPDIWAFSGNGWHVLYRIDMPNTVAATARVKGVIETVSARFTDRAVSVDRTVFNAARIWKLYGTTSRKGDEVGDRRHRLARITGRFFT